MIQSFRSLAVVVFVYVTCLSAMASPGLPDAMRADAGLNQTGISESGVLAEDLQKAEEEAAAKKGCNKKTHEEVVIDGRKRCVPKKK